MDMHTLLKTTLAYYDRTKPVEVHTDASEYGLGAASSNKQTCRICFQDPNTSGIKVCKTLNVNVYQ